jgi:hypothetical protein
MSVSVLAGSAACSPADLARLPAPGTAEDGNTSLDPNRTVAGGPLTPGIESLSGSALPPVLGALHPQDGSQVCRRPQVGLDLLLSDAMRKDGSFDPSAITLLLDDQDVTDAAVIRETQTYPASRATIMYVPSTDLALGVHHAAVTYPGLGGASSYAWSFTVAHTPCP